MKQNKLFIVTLIIGIVILLYPIISELINSKHQSYVITKYTEQIKKTNNDKIKEKKKQYEQYNKTLTDNSSSTVDLLQKGEILGYIKIAKIGVFLPIYEGTDSKILDKGIGHMEKTTLPTKNYSYHSVLVGHTGITGKKLFDDLIDLKIDDSFEITILNENFTYRIKDIKTVLPNQTKDLKVHSNKQLVTLVTCTPKYVNSHRLLVTGELN